MLVVGDSVAQNANYAAIEKVTKCRIRTTKAYSSVRDNKARYPAKNISEVAPRALVDTPEEDDFSMLVVAAPTVDISNMDATILKPGDNIDVFKHNVIESCKNVITVAQNAIITNPKLQKIILLEHAPRFDTVDVDPTGIKPKLAHLANATLNDMVNNSGMKDRISIGKLNLNCHGDEVGARYRDSWTGKFDGVHMYSSHGKDVFTRSMLEIFKSILPRPHNRGTHSSSSPPPSTHFRSKFQKKQKTKMFSQNNQQYENAYSVPVRNQFETLGN